MAMMIAVEVKGVATGINMVSSLTPEHFVLTLQFFTTRVAHGFGQTRGFCRAGPTGTGPVSDFADPRQHRTRDG